MTTLPRDSLLRILLLGLGIAIVIALGQLGFTLSKEGGLRDFGHAVDLVWDRTRYNLHLSDLKEPEMVSVPTEGLSLAFQMGSRDGAEEELPVHAVALAKPFAIGKYEVTFEEYEEYARRTGAEIPGDEGWGRGERPVINVSWDDASGYARWLSSVTGKSYRLPTEAEWEFASRAGTASTYWWGEEIGENRANCDGCGSQWDGEQTAPVGSFAPNPWGLHDTLGNVWEWVADCWHQTYEEAPDDGSKWTEAAGGDCTRRLVRGGAWMNRPWNLRSALRFGADVDFRFPFLGFRLAQDL